MPPIVSRIERQGFIDGRADAYKAYMAGRPEPTYSGTFGYYGS